MESGFKLLSRIYLEKTNFTEWTVYKMLKSKILEVENPGWDWFYERF